MTKKTLFSKKNVIFSELHVFNAPNRGSFVKKSKKSQVSVGNSSKSGGGLRKSKKVPSSRGYQRLKNNDSF